MEYENQFFNLLNLAALAADAKFSVMTICETGQTISRKNFSEAQKEHVKTLEKWVLNTSKPLIEASIADSSITKIQKTKSISPLRFYAGLPLIGSNKTCFGILSVFDEATVFLTRKQRMLLKGISQQIAALWENVDALDETKETPDLDPENEKSLTEHFKRAQHLLRSGSWEYFQESGKIFWSPEARRIFGVNEKNFVSSLEEFISYVHLDDRVAIVLAQERFIRHGTPYAIRHRICRPDGEIVTVFNIAEVVNKDDESKKRLVGNIVNLSESPVTNWGYEISRKIEFEHFENFDEKNYFRALFDASPEPYLVLTPDEYRIVAANQARLEVTKTRREDIIGRRLFDLFPDDPTDPTATGVANLRASLERVKQNREIDIMAVQRYPIRLPEKEGGNFVERYWTPINSPVLNNDGSIACIIHRVEDVTEYIWSQKNDAVTAASKNPIAPMETDIILRSIELKQLAEKAKQNERRFRSAFTNSLIGMSVATLDGRLTECNDRLAEIIGYSATELRGMSIKHITHPDDWDKNAKMLSELIQGKCKAFEIRKRYLHKSGKTVWVSNYVSTILDNDVRPYRLYAAVIDITEEHNAKQKLLQQEALLQIGERMAKVGSWSYACEDGEQWRWSDELYQIHGLPLSAPLSFEKIVDYFMPQWRSVFEIAHEKCLRNGTSYDFEAEILNMHSQATWVRIIGEAKLDDEGKIVGAHGAYLDISKARKSEAVLREQATLLDVATDAIIVRSLDDRILYWNKAAEKLYGWKANEVLGRAVKEVLYSKSNVPFEEALNRLKRDGDYSGQITHTRKNGSKVVVRSHWTLVRNDDGSPKSILAIHTDITDRIEMEQKMVQLQKLNALGQLTGGIAHDFNNLLTVINGSAEILIEESEDSQLTRELAYTIFSAGERGAQLTNRLLAFARRQELVPNAVDLRIVVNNMKGMLQRILGEQMQLSTCYADDVWPAFLDEAQFESALLNLCINARDAMPDGGEVKIEMENTCLDERYVEKNPDAKPGDYVMVAVSDAGMGMTEEVISKAFEPFFTTKGNGQGSAKGNGQGSGLGLSIVYGFIAQSQGHIRIISSPGVGTVVKMYFLKAAAERPEELESRFLLKIEGAGEFILMVEDNELVKSHGKRVLEELGYRVHTAADGNEAMALLQSGNRYDLLFTDVVMPRGMSGIQLAERALKLDPDIRILLTTGYSEAIDNLDADAHIGFPILHKPYRRKVLAAMVRKALQFDCR